MIDLYFWPTYNGWKVTVLLEELGLDYRVIPVNILKGEQFAPEFVALNPNGKIPVLVDSDVTLFESGAIMLYLAEKTGRFFSETTRGKYEVLQWLMFQMSGVGPFFSQANHFTRYAGEEVPYAIDRYTNEALRLLCVMDKRLDGRNWISGDDYSIADIALFGWTQDMAKEDGFSLPYAEVADWLARVAARPAVKRGLAVLADRRRASHQKFDQEAHSALFGESE